MEEGLLKQEFFISDEGYINIRLKVKTEDTEIREKIIAALMRATYKKEGFTLSDYTEVDLLYFHNSDPETCLKELKEKVLKGIEEFFVTL